jgi:hypothetical protein
VEAQKNEGLVRYGIEAAVETRAAMQQIGASSLDGLKPEMVKWVW